MPADQQDQVTRRFGRKVTNLRRKADNVLPARSAGARVSLTTKKEWAPAGSGVAPLSAAPKRTLHTPPHLKPRPTGPTAGGLIESWCGPCKDLKEHTIVAMVDGVPKQVLCESCGARHNYREGPPRKAPSPVTSSKRAPSRVEVERERLDAEMAALRDELDQATDVRPFVKHGRYKVGEIIDHPEHGRGKVEHCKRDIVLVRFRSGRRPV